MHTPFVSLLHLPFLSPTPVVNDAQRSFNSLHCSTSIDVAIPRSPLVEPIRLPPITQAEQQEEEAKEDVEEEVDSEIDQSSLKGPFLGRPVNNDLLVDYRQHLTYRI
ncbi:hypothetical protein QJS04_geneDACA004703 [Acorus gramineus]|uniref:Uncharacterized protein n=1 Tax=Acorus gramineus TaxID=55184 RepID=A0AAV9BVR6_ACOGR|nr:hypothetical protein QJS04_geneDACA004703 [Acorus gramineus]